MLLQEGPGVVLALPDSLALIAVPGTRFFHHVVQHTKFDQFALLGDAGAVHDFEFCFTERRRDLVLDYFDAGHRAHHFLSILDRADAPDVHAHGRIELERVAAGRGLRVTEHHADLHADLIDEYHDGIGSLDIAGELAQGLRHEARLQAHVRVAHLAFDFRFRRERRNRVDHHYIEGAGAHQNVGDFERLFAGVRL